jgi:hypothetical protein
MSWAATVASLFLLIYFKISFAPEYNVVAMKFVLGHFQKFKDNISM